MIELNFIEILQGNKISSLPGTTQLDQMKFVLRKTVRRQTQTSIYMHKERCENAIQSYVNVIGSQRVSKNVVNVLKENISV